jgi:hypothetical protein
MRPDGEAELEAEIEEDRLAIAAKVEAIMEEAETLDQTVGALVAVKDEMGIAAEDLLGFVFEAVRRRSRRAVAPHRTGKRRCSGTQAARARSLVPCACAWRRGRSRGRGDSTSDAARRCSRDSRALACLPRLRSSVALSLALLPCARLIAQVFDEDILKDEQVKASAKLFLRLQKLCAKPKTAQTVVLVCIERLCGERFEEALLKKAPHVLKAFYDLDLLEEEAIVHWSEKKSKTNNREVSKKVKKAAEPFITWLKEADEDDSEGDDEDDE